ncbi:MAG: sulfotransferase family 2 domain-containing protein [Pseudomonadota bacterium]
MIVHTHLEKCGGSTLLHYLTLLIGKEHTLDLRPFLGKKSAQGYRKIQNKKHSIRLLSGHFRYNSGWAKLVPNQHWLSKIISPLIAPSCRKHALHIASVRHPIDRLDSLFRYLKTRPRHYLYNHHIIKNDFDGFIQSLITSNNQLVNNGMCAQLAKCTPGANILDKAKKSFDQHYLAMVPFDKTHELANMLADVFQLPLVKEKIINKSEPTAKVIPSTATLLLLEKKCADDIQFYNYVVNQYPTKLLEAKQYLQQLIAK